MTVYSLKDPATGLYRYHGTWASEPEWFSWAAAKNLMEAGYLPPMVLQPYTLTHDDLEG